MIGAVEARAPARPWWRRVRNSQAVTGYLFVLPLALPIFVFHYASMLFSLAISLTDWSGITPRPVFVGLGNYVGLVQDPTFWNALKKFCRPARRPCCCATRRPWTMCRPCRACGEASSRS